MSRLAWKLYLATVVQVVVVFATTLFFLVRSAHEDGFEGPRGLLHVPGLVAQLWSQPKERDALLRVVADNFSMRLVLRDKEGRELSRFRVAPEVAPIVARSETLSVASADGVPLGTLEATRMLPPPPRLLVFGLAATSLLVLAGMTMFIARSFVRPLTQLGEAAQRLGRGQLASRSGVVRRDEIGGLAATFDEMAARIESLVQAQSELLANVSHELRTPLARMRVALDLSAAGVAPDPETMADLARDVGELEHLLKEVLDTARLDILPQWARTGWIASQIERTDLVDFTRDAARRFSLRHPDRALELQVPPALEDSVAVPLLRRALDNLLDNAAKYSQPPHPIALALRASEAGLELVVEDHGQGMTAKELARAFEPFYRADQSRSKRTSGLGLGLTFARRVVEAQGGKLELRSVPGRGTVAVISLPNPGPA